METEEELILKFGWIGWKGDLGDIDSLLIWLYRKFGIDVVEKKSGYSLIFQGRVLCDYYGKGDILNRILPDIMLLWKCENGKLDGPSLENYEEPDTYWT